MTIRIVKNEDVGQILDIYNGYVLTSTATFEETPPDPGSFAARVKRIAGSYPYLVAEEDGKIVGYAYLDKFNERSAYRKTADLSIYLAPDRKGKAWAKPFCRTRKRGQKNRRNRDNFACHGRKRNKPRFPPLVRIPRGRNAYRRRRKIRQKIRRDLFPETYSIVFRRDKRNDGDLVVFSFYTAVCGGDSR